MSRLSGRMGNERLITGLPPARCIWFDYAYNVVIPYRRKGSPEVEIAMVRWLEYVRRRSSCVPKSPLGLTLPARKIFPSPPRRSARDALPYTRLCVCSSSLLARP